jgi:hypothetical protein
MKFMLLVPGVLSNNLEIDWQRNSFHVLAIIMQQQDNKSAILEVNAIHCQPGTGGPSIATPFRLTQNPSWNERCAMLPP